MRRLHRLFRNVRVALVAPAVCALLGACGAGSDDERPEVALSAQASLGEKIFHDASLSASGRMSCATCHVAEAAHAQNNGLAAQAGGPDLTRQGSRTSPSIRYLAFAPPFRIDSSGVPSGGLFWDGRADSLADQARRPFFSPVEMALSDPMDLAARLAGAEYAEEFRRVFGATILDRPSEALDGVTAALAAFQREHPELQPFSSKFDAVRAGRATFSALEQRGLELFNHPLKGNCLFCHPSTPEPDGRPPLFTNFSYFALGVPRNTELVANADSAHFDLGLCEREGGALRGRADLCGAFRVPSLRNVAQRQAFFHNGRFKSLRAVLSFYAARDIDPGQFYPLRADGSVDRFDDLPQALRGAVVVRIAPYDRQPGQTPALTDEEIDAILAFLGTLSDGYLP